MNGRLARYDFNDLQWTDMTSVVQWSGVTICFSYVPHQDKVIKVGVEQWSSEVALERSNIFAIWLEDLVRESTHGLGDREIAYVVSDFWEFYAQRGHCRRPSKETHSTRQRRQVP